MSSIENRSQLNAFIWDLLSLDNDTQSTLVFDTTPYVKGFNIFCIGYVSNTYSLSFQLTESDNADMSNSSIITGDRLTGNIADLQPPLSSAVGIKPEMIGVVDGKKYLRLDVTHTGTAFDLYVMILASRAFDVDATNSSIFSYMFNDGASPAESSNYVFNSGDSVDESANYKFNGG